MKFTEIGVARALRVYADVARKVGVDGAKHDKPIEQDRVWQRIQRLETHWDECHSGRCPLRVKELPELRALEAEERANLVAIGKILAEAGFGSGHIVDGVRRMAEALKGMGECT